VLAPVAGPLPPDEQPRRPAIRATAASVAAAVAARRENDMIPILPHGPDSFGQQAATRSATGRQPAARQSGAPPVTFRREFDTRRRQLGAARG
jgi:hypothetical protein